MKYLSLIIIGALLMAPIYSPKIQADEQLAKAVCDYVATNNKNRLRKKLKQNRIKIRNVYDAISCEGESLIRFAIKKEAGKVGRFLIKQLPPKALQKHGDIEWAEQNGFSSSTIIAEIKERINS